MKNQVDQLVFTYGSLKRGFHNFNNILKGNLDKGTVEFVGDFHTKPEYTLISLGHFPGVVCKGITSIKGELFRIKDQGVLDRLNRLESHFGKGNPENFYDITEVETPHGEALMYVLDEKYLSGKGIITTGEWL